MNELDRLQRLAAETRLLVPRGDVDNMRRTSYEFTRRAASLLRREGWRMLRAPPGGNNIDGFRIDKIINADSLEIVDIIVNADDPDPNAPPRSVSWQPQGFGRVSDVGEPIEDGGPPPEPAPAPTQPDADDPVTLLLVETAARLISVVEDLNATITQLLAKVNELQRDGVRVRLR